VVILLRGILTEFITARMIARRTSQEEEVAA
jgi:sorbitol-specific phosphotransferase system component IIC